MADVKMVLVVTKVRIGADGGIDPATQNKSTRWHEPGQTVSVAAADAAFLIKTGKATRAPAGAVASSAVPVTVPGAPLP